jgi:hypothetical protein
LAQSNAANTSSSPFAHGQVISFGDGQQAIIVQNPDQSGTPQIIQIPSNMSLPNGGQISIGQSNSNQLVSPNQAITIPANGLGNVIMMMPSGVAGAPTNAGLPQSIQRLNFTNTTNNNGQIPTNGASNIVLQQPVQQQQQQTTTHQQSNSGANTPNSDTAEEEPLYVNAKQYNRILKRRLARAKLENEGRIPKNRQVREEIFEKFYLIKMLFS